MGIDSRIVIKLRQADAPTDAWLRRMSFMLCSSIGAQHFFTEDGITDPAEYRAAADAWHAKFRSHPLYPHKTRDEWERIVCDIGGPAPRARQLAIELTHDYEGGQAGKIYQQDGDDVNAADGEWLLEVNVWTRFYGVGYERGDLMTLCAIAEWIEFNIPNSEVWYGGDSSGACIERFDVAARTELKRHYYSLAGRDYFRRGVQAHRVKLPEKCSRCPDDGPHFDQNGFGGNFCAISCAGCGLSCSTRDNGLTWNKEEK